MTEDQGKDIYEPVETRMKFRAVSPHHKFFLVAEEDGLRNCAHHVEEEQVTQASQADPHGNREG